MRLGFHYHVPAQIDDSRRIRTPGYQGLFLDSLAARCDHLVIFLHAPREDERSRMDYSLQQDNVSLVSMGPHASVPYRLRNAHRLLSPLQEMVPVLDAMLLRGPSPLLPSVARMVRGVPLALLLVGDYVDGIGDLKQPFWRKQAINLYSHYNRWAQTRVAKRSLTFVNSYHLFERLSGHVPNLVETRTTTLRQGDVVDQPLKSVGTPVQLIYSGRMDRAKGLFEMVEALKWLEEQGMKAVLNLVGWAEPGDSVLEELMGQAARLGLRDHIRYHGYVPAGDSLIKLYRSADVFVTASLRSEGFPRTIWEAMASSLPVVATAVGAIPHYLSDRVNARIVAPGDGRALGQGIFDVVEDDGLRETLIIHGRELANGNTLDNRADELIDRIKLWTTQNQNRS